MTSSLWSIDADCCKTTERQQVRQSRTSLTPDSVCHWPATSHRAKHAAVLTVWIWAYESQHPSEVIKPHKQCPGLDLQTSSSHCPKRPLSKTLQRWNSIWTHCAVLMPSDQLLFLWRCEAKWEKPETGPGSLLVKKRGTTCAENLSLVMFLDQGECDRCRSQPTDLSRSVGTNDLSHRQHDDRSIILVLDPQGFLRRFVAT